MKTLLRPTAVSLVTLFLLLSVQPAHHFAQTESRKTYKFIHGRWFDGKSFQPQTFYSVNGILTKKKPRGEFETIDLANQFVLPPFAEAHNHNIGSAIYLDREFTQKMIQRYLDAGIFYVKTPGNPADNAKILRRDFVNRPNSIDVSFANAVLTSRDGHPIGMTLDSYKQAGIKVPTVAELEENKIFYLIESEADLRTKWPQIIADKPDFLKTILRHSENFAQRRETASLFGYNGLDPQLLPLIVKQAHAAGLRVSTHIDSAADFAVAVNAGVDEINHLPGAMFEAGTNEADYLITRDVAMRAAKRGTIVVTTTNIAQLFAKGDKLTSVQATQVKNLRLLKESGVRLAIGSDNFMTTSLEEAMYLKSLDVFTNAELIEMWTIVAAQTIFPQRKIGRLSEGYEASFVVLRSNPLENFESVKDIHLRFKQGVVIGVSQ
jgi:hypothetical protein